MLASIAPVIVDKTSICYYKVNINLKYLLDKKKIFVLLSTYFFYCYQEISCNVQFNFPFSFCNNVL